MEARALKKQIRLSPRKMRLVIDLIRGKKAADALNILQKILLLLLVLILDFQCLNYFLV